MQLHSADDKLSDIQYLKQSQTRGVLKIWITNVHQEQQLHCATNQALKLYLNMHVYVYKSCKLHPSWQEERADCGRELSWINVALTFTCHVFDADTFSSESEKPLLLLQRNFLYLSDAACVAFNLQLWLKWGVHACSWAAGPGIISTSPKGLGRTGQILHGKNCSQCTKSSTSCNAKTFGKWRVENVMLESHHEIIPLFLH